MSALPEITVFSRRGCHLCEDLIEELVLLVRDQATIRVEDVDTNPEWVKLYGELVPVVYYAGAEVCRYHLDRSAILALLNSGDNGVEGAAN